MPVEIWLRVLVQSPGIRAVTRFRDMWQTCACEGALMLNNHAGCGLLIGERRC